jgi:hypothetical protein
MSEQRVFRKIQERKMGHGVQPKYYCLTRKYTRRRASSLQNKTY